MTFILQLLISEILNPLHNGLLINFNKDFVFNATKNFCLANEFKNNIFLIRMCDVLLEFSSENRKKIGTSMSDWD